MKRKTFKYASLVIIICYEFLLILQRKTNEFQLGRLTNKISNINLIINDTRNFQNVQM